MVARRSPKRARVKPQVSVEEVGLHLINAMRVMYHYSCQYQGRPSERVASLLAVYLFIDELAEQLYADFDEACDDEELDPQVVLERLPASMRQTVQEFFEHHISHGAEPAAVAFTFQQPGYGSA